MGICIKVSYTVTNCFCYFIYIYISSCYFVRHKVIRVFLKTPEHVHTVRSLEDDLHYGVSEDSGIISVLLRCTVVLLKMYYC